MKPDACYSKPVHVRDSLGLFTVTSFAVLSDLFYKLAQLVGIFFYVARLYERKECSACDLCYLVITVNLLASIDIHIKTEYKFKGFLSNKGSRSKCSLFSLHI